MDYKQVRDEIMAVRTENLRRWLDATSTKNGLHLDPAEADVRRLERARVISRARTTIGTLIVACSRGRIGDDLAFRLREATAGEANRVFVD